MIASLLREPWPWYISGPLMGLFVPLLLLVGNRQMGMTGSLRAMCAAFVPGKVEFFRYDWRANGAWSVALALGILVGAGIGATFLDAAATPALADRTRDVVQAMGLDAPAGLLPAEIFSWRALMTIRGAVFMLGGGFLVGFGSSYAGGCTSGHGILGLASLQVASLIALVGVFAGGLVATFLLIPRLV